MLNACAGRPDHAVRADRCCGKSSSVRRGPVTTTQGNWRSPSAALQTRRRLPNGTSLSLKEKSPCLGGDRKHRRFVHAVQGCQHPFSAGPLAGGTTSGLNRGAGRVVSFQEAPRCCRRAPCATFEISPSCRAIPARSVPGRILFVFQAELDPQQDPSRTVAPPGAATVEEGSAAIFHGSSSTGATESPSNPVITSVTST